MAAAVALLPWRWLDAWGRALGALVGSVLRVRRDHVEEAMSQAGCAAPRRLASGMYRSLGIGAFELLWTLGRRGRSLEEVATLGPGLRRMLERARTETGRGIVLATAHTGNWDLSACALARQGFPLTVVTKRLSVVWLDAYWQRARSAEGIELVDGEGSFARTLDALRRGRFVAQIIDQAPERASAVIRAPFLGRVARCDLAPAMLAARTGATLALVLGRRLPDGTHLVDVELILEPPARAGRAWIESATTTLQAALGQFVRAYPDQWLWLHRRWKAVDVPARAASRLVSAQGQS